MDILTQSILFLSVAGAAYLLTRTLHRNPTPATGPTGTTLHRNFTWQLHLLNAGNLPLQAGLLAAIAAAVITFAANLPTLLIVASAALFALLGRSAVLILRDRVRSQFEEQFVTALELLTSGLRSGQSLPQAIASSAQFLPRPLAGEFALMARQLKIGTPPGEVLDGLAHRIPSPDVRQAATAMRFGMLSGIKLTDVFTEIAETYRARRLLMRKIDALTAMGKAQAFFLALLPLGFLAVGSVAFPQNISVLVTTSAGNLALLVVVVLQLLTFLLVNRLARVDV